MICKGRCAQRRPLLRWPAFFAAERGWAPWWRKTTATRDSLWRDNGNATASRPAPLRSRGGCTTRAWARKWPALWSSLAGCRRGAHGGYSPDADHRRIAQAIRPRSSARSPSRPGPPGLHKGGRGSGVGQRASMGGSRLHTHELIPFRVRPSARLCRPPLASHTHSGLPLRARPGLLSTRPGRAPGSSNHREHHRGANAKRRCRSPRLGQVHVPQPPLGRV